MTDKEIRTDFATLLIRIFGDMEKGAACTCGTDTDLHHVGCAKYHWSQAARIVQDTKESLNGE